MNPVEIVFLGLALFMAGAAIILEVLYPAPGDESAEDEQW